jgi:uncharacterized protein
MDWTTLAFIIIGAAAGALSGLVGVGGGIVVVPALVLLMGFSQKMAQGTTLALLVPPVGVFAAVTYYRHGYVNLKAALLIAIGFVIGTIISSHFAVRLPERMVARAFGGVLLLVAAKLLILGH